MSGRSCSDAWRVFFSSDGVTHKAALSRAETKAVTMEVQGFPQLLGGEVGRLLEQRSDQTLQASIRPDQRSPPNVLGRGIPKSRSRALQRLTLAALTPKRSAAWRCLSPLAKAARTRARRSSERAFDMFTGLLIPANMLNQKRVDLGTPTHSFNSGNALCTTFWAQLRHT